MAGRFPLPSSGDGDGGVQGPLSDSPYPARAAPFLGTFSAVDSPTRLLPRPELPGEAQQGLRALHLHFQSRGSGKTAVVGSVSASSSQIITALPSALPPRKSHNPQITFPSSAHSF